METNSTSVTFIIHMFICSDSFCIPMKPEYQNSENKQENKNTQNTYTVSPIPNLLTKGKKQTECLLPYCNLQLTHLKSIFWWYLFKIVHSQVIEERSYPTSRDLGPTEISFSQSSLTIFSSKYTDVLWEKQQERHQHPSPLLSLTRPSVKYL